MTGEFKKLYQFEAFGKSLRFLNFMEVQKRIKVYNKTIYALLLFSRQISERRGPELF